MNSNRHPFRAERSRAARARLICGYRTWNGYALVARIARTTAKGALLTNDTADLWIPLSQIRRVDLRLQQVHVTNWIAGIHRDQLSLTDPLDIAGKRGLAAEARAEHEAYERMARDDDLSLDLFH